MRTLLLARKILALSICLALPMPGLAANMSRVNVSGVRAAAFGAPAEAFHQELLVKLDNLIPAGVPATQAITGAALYEMIAQRPQREAVSDSRAQAYAFIARLMVLPKETARQELQAAHVPEQQAELILAAAEGAQARRGSDKFLNKALKLIEKGKQPTVGVMFKAREYAANLEAMFKQTQPEALLVDAAALKIDGDKDMRGNFGIQPEQTGTDTLRAEANPFIKAGFVPVSKKVTELRVLSEKDPEAAFAKAEGILATNEEPRVEIRAAALRAIAGFPAARRLPVVLKAAENPINWYIQRMAIEMVGSSAAELGDSRETSEKILREAYKSSSSNVRLMAKASLEKMGLDAGPEVAPKLVDSIRGRVPRPGAPNGFMSNNGGGQPQGPKRGNNTFKFILLGSMLAALIYMMSGPGSQTAKPVPAPQQIEQTIEAPKLPEAKTPEEARQNQLVTEVHQLAETAKRAEAQRIQERAEDKAAAEKAKGNPIVGTLMSIAFMILPIFLLVWLFKRMQGGAASGAMKQLSGGKMNLEKPDTKFTDVAGVDDALLQMQQVADYIRNPKRYTRLGGTAPKGVLLEGPPGTGKTLMARALAGESEANFISMKGSDFIEMFVGVGASRVRELFEVARKNAPTIIFIDEIDAIGKARGKENISGGGSEHEQTLISLIAELDGFIGMENVIVVAATNRSDVLDPALMRPGRFDTKIYVGNPEVLGREAILAVHGAKYRLGADVDLEFTARRTAGLAGAGMANILKSAAKQGGMEDHDSITRDDVQLGVDKETMGERRNLFLGDSLKRRVTLHEVGHMVAMKRANPKAATPNKITNIPHGANALGYAEQAEEEPGSEYLLTQRQLEDKIVGAMGGRAAEEMFYGQDDPKEGPSTGPGSDIQHHADRYARAMVEKLGMSEKVGIIYNEETQFGARSVSERMKWLMDKEVTRITGEALVRARALLANDRALIAEITDALMKNETLYQADLDAILEKYPAQPQ